MVRGDKLYAISYQPYANFAPLASEIFLSSMPERSDCYAMDNTAGCRRYGLHLVGLLASRARPALARRERKRRQSRLRLHSGSIGKWSRRTLHDAASVFGDGAADGRSPADHYRRS